MSNRVNHHYTRVQLLETVPMEFRPMIDEIIRLFWSYADIQFVVQRNVFVFKFPKKWRAYLQVQEKKKCVIFGLWSGAKMIKQNPALAFAFDEVKLVVGKIYLYLQWEDGLEQVRERNIKELIGLAIAFSSNGNAWR